MFKPVSMKKVFILGLKDQAEQATAALARTGLVHLERLDGGQFVNEGFSPGRDEALERVYQTMEERTSACCAALGFIPDGELTPSDLLFDVRKEADALSAQIAQIAGLCDGQTSRRRALQEEERQLAGIRNGMELLKGLDADLAAYRNLHFFKMTLGLVERDKLRLLKEACRDRFALLDRKVRKREHLIVVISDKEDQELLEKILSGAFVQELVVPEHYWGNPVEMLKKIQARLRQIGMEKVQIGKNLAQLKEDFLPHLIAVGKRLHGARLHFFARDHFRNSRDVLLLTGWLPADQVELLKAQLAGGAAGAELVVVEDSRALSDSAVVPTLLRNRWWIKPFEGILKIYGLPNYREMDPTVYLTAGFILMFGMMFGDVGHGLFLASVGGWLRWGPTGRKKTALKDVGMLLLACGGASAVFGFLFGSFFGFEDVLHPLWYSPFGNVNFGLMVAIAWGVFFLLCGALINIVNCLANGRVIEAGLGSKGLAGIWFYLGGVALVAGLLGGIAPLKSFPALIALFFLPMVLIGLKEPLEVWYHAGQSRKTEGEKLHKPHAKTSAMEIIILSVMEIYDTILSYLSNTLSFMRLAAFALNHVALLLAVFAIAQIIRDGSGSGVLYWVTVVFGNLLVIGLEGMIVTIQTLRLIYYEGFSKFFRGDGVAYEPFSVTTSVKS